MSEKKNLREWIRRRKAEEQAKIDGLPFDPSFEDLRQYWKSVRELVKLGQMEALHFPPEKAEPELEEVLY